MTSGCAKCFRADQSRGLDMESDTIDGTLLAVVTVADIEKARRNRSCGCAVEVALSRIYNRTALVAYETQWLRDGSRKLSARATVERQSWVLPEHVVQFLRDFDQGCNVRPITFQIPRKEI